MLTEFEARRNIQVKNKFSIYTPLNPLIKSIITLSNVQKYPLMKIRFFFIFEAFESTSEYFSLKNHRILLQLVTQSDYVYARGYYF